MPENSLLSRAFLCSSEMAQRVKAFAPEPGDLSSIPRTYMVEEENSSKLSPGFYTLCISTHDSKQVFFKSSFLKHIHKWTQNYFHHTKQINAENRSDRISFFSLHFLLCIDTPELTALLLTYEITVPIRIFWGCEKEKRVEEHLLNLSCSLATSYSSSLLTEL